MDLIGTINNTPPQRIYHVLGIYGVYKKILYIRQLSKFQNVEMVNTIFYHNAIKLALLTNM